MSATATTLTTEEMIARNGALIEAFTQSVIADPAVDDVPAGATLVLLPAADPALLEANIAAGLAAIRRGENVYFRSMPPAAPDPE